MRTAMALLCILAICGSAEGKDVEAEARKIDDLLMAPCCWTQPVSKHYSGSANEIRRGVREMLREGKTRQEVLDFYVEKYGQRILAMPPARGFNITAYVLPAVFLIAGGWVLVAVFRKLRAGRPAGAPPARASASEGGYAKRLERELRERE